MTASPNTSYRRRLAAAAALACALSLAACGEDSAGGTVQVFVEAEDSIPAGIAPGSGADNIADGWKVTYSKFLVAIGNFRAARSADGGDRLGKADIVVVDLTQLPTSGLVLASFADVTAARFDKVGFDLARATSGATKADGTAQADFDEMLKNGWSLRVVGAIEKGGDTVTFDWGIDAATSFDDCAPSQGDAGFAVPSGGTVQVKPTVHGDHWFFTNITQGAEITERRAQWVKDSDLDSDGVVTLAELAQVKAADVFPAAQYNLSGAIISISSARDYFEAQARTLGDFQGEGECPTRNKL